MENFTSNYDALQTAAENATKGIWINVGAWVENERDDLKDICDCRPNGNEDDEQALLDATYIALANPDTILRLLRDRRDALDATSQHPMQASVAAIQYALDAEEGFEWLSLWNEGEFERCRRDWPDAPDDCYIGADPMHPETQPLLAVAAPVPADEWVAFEEHARYEGMDMSTFNDNTFRDTHTAAASLAWNAALEWQARAASANATCTRGVRAYPNELTDALRHVLGFPNFRCAPYAQLMRDGGATIKKRAEDEQAHVLHWLVKLVLDHGERWADVGEDELRSMRAKPDAGQEGGATQ